MSIKERIKKKIIIFTNADWHFYAHLLPIAREALGRGYEVKLLTNVDQHQSKIEKEGITVIPVTFNRSGLNPFAELLFLIRLIFIVSKEKPDILHNCTIKPILYGTIIGFFCRTPVIINNYLGMGYLFISTKIVARNIRNLMCKILSILSRFRKVRYVVQNSDDRQLLIDLNIAKPHNVINQCSVGIDINNFPLLPEPKGKIVLTLVARMLIDKGVYEFIEAAKILHKQNVNAEFWLVGSPDKGNKSSVDEKILKQYHAQGYIKYLGYQNDIQKIWEQAHVAVLPSYREGLSRSLLEAGAYGRAIITTDAPGGRELVKNQINGLLVPIKNSEKLAEAMKNLVDNTELRKIMAMKIRDVIQEQYNYKLITEKMVDLY